MCIIHTFYPSPLHQCVNNHVYFIGLVPEWITAVSLMLFQFSSFVGELLVTNVKCGRSHSLSHVLVCVFDEIFFFLKRRWFQSVMSQHLLLKQPAALKFALLIPLVRKSHFIFQPLVDVRIIIDGQTWTTQLSGGQQGAAAPLLSLREVETLRINGLEWCKLLKCFLKACINTSSST